MFCVQIKPVWLNLNKTRYWPNTWRLRRPCGSAYSGASFRSSSPAWQDQINPSDGQEGRQHRPHMSEVNGLLKTSSKWYFIHYFCSKSETFSLFLPYSCTFSFHQTFHGPPRIRCKGDGCVGFVNRVTWSQNHQLSHHMDLGPKLILQSIKSLK